MSESSKSGALGRAFYFLISLIVRLSYKFVLNNILVSSAGITVYTIGEYIHKFIKDKPAVLNVIYWRKPIKSISVLLSILFSLFLFSKLTVLVIVAYMSLAALVFTLSSRIYNLILARLNKSDGANPFAPYLAQEFEVPQEKVHAQVDLLLENSKITAEKLKRLFLVENICESVKFGLLLWTFSYIGTWFSGIGLVTLFVIGAFSIPRFTKIYKEPIDAQLAIAKEYFNKVQAIITEKVPFLAHCIPDAKKKN